MFLRINEIASLLDTNISKGLKRKRKTISDHEETISKGLSFNPFEPTKVSSAESQHYTPYLQADDGGFYPHPVNHWMDMGKDPGTYRTTVDFYGQASAKHDTMEMLQNLQDASRHFSFVRKAMGPMGETALPIGTIHTYGNGERYKKVAFKQWRHVSEGSSMPKPKVDITQHGHTLIEAAAKKGIIQKELEKRGKAEKTTRKIVKDEIKQHTVKQDEKAIQKKTKEKVKIKAKADKQKLTIDKKKSGTVRDPKPKTEDQKIVSETKRHFDTEAQHSDGQGNYTPERQKLHEKILDHFMGHVKAETHHSGPFAIMSGGGTASGKGYVAKRALKGLDPHVHIDPDEIKNHLPEYKAMQSHGGQTKKEAAGHVHEESSMLSKEMIKRSMEQNKSIFYDSTMNKKQKFHDLIDAFKKSGYSTHIVFADLQIAKAIERQKVRSKKTGRDVKESFVKESNKNAVGTLGSIFKSADTTHVYHTGIDNSEPVLAFSRVNGQSEVHHQEIYQGMKDRGHLVKSLMEFFNV